MRKLSLLLTAATTGLLATGAMAETLPVAGIYAAGENAAAPIQQIAVDTFGGQAGERLAFAIEERLRSVQIDGTPWFDVTLQPQSSDIYLTYEGQDYPEPRGASEGVLRNATMRGTASVEVNDTPSGYKDVSRCVERDDKKKCVREVIDRFDCWDVAVGMRPQLRLIGSDGRTLYGKSDYVSTSQRFCEDENSQPSIDRMVDDLINRIANSVRYDLAPHQRNEGIRVLESRKGIAKSDRKAFKNAVKLTKNDPYGACAAFAALEENNPNDVSVLFNIGLCEEGEGNLVGAERYYMQVLEIEPGKDYAQSGLSRIASRRRAMYQMQVHYAEDRAEDEESEGLGIDG